MRASVLLLCAVVLSGGCSRVSLVRVAGPQAEDAPPRIESVVDLGALPLAAQGELSRQHHDGVFTPGEWMAVLGSGLARTGARVHVGGRAVDVAGFVDGGLLVRVPRGLSPRARVVVRVETARGHSEQAIPYRGHVVVSDVSGNRLRFLPMGLDAEKLFLEPYDLELPRVRKHVFTPDGGVVYAVQAHAEHTADEYTIATVHVGAAEHPALLHRLPVKLTAVPRDLVAAPLRNQLWLLSDRELVVLDVSTGVPRETGRVALPEGGTAWSLVSLVDGTRAAVLERERNLLWVFDMTGTAPHPVQTFALPPGDMARASIAMLADPHDAARLWVLQGRSLARIAERANRRLEPVRKSVAAARAVVGLGEPPPSDVPAEGEQASSEEAAPPARVLELRLAPELALTGEVLLPDATVPLFLRMGIDGRLLVSVIASDVTKLEALRNDPYDVTALTAWLFGTAQFGRVLAVDPTGQRAPEVLVQGMAMFFDIDQLPDGQLVCSVMRLGARVLPFGPAVDWKIEAPHLDAVGMRKLKWTFLLPPYVSPPVTVQ